MHHKTSIQPNHAATDYPEVSLLDRAAQAVWNGLAWLGLFSSIALVLFFYGYMTGQ